MDTLLQRLRFRAGNNVYHFLVLLRKFLMLGFVPRLTPSVDEEIHPIPAPLLRKYINYCRRFVKPRCAASNHCADLLRLLRLSDEAGRMLQAFYLQLREKYRRYLLAPLRVVIGGGGASSPSTSVTSVDSADAPPITTRQLESLIRLAEARARLEATDTVTEQHAQARVRGVVVLQDPIR